MDLILWVVQIVLALAFLGAGVMHATGRDRATGGMAWMLAVAKSLLTTIGVLEILGAIGLVAPLAAGIATWLTPLAALALAVLMAFAAAFHARRSGELPNVAINLVLGLVAALVTWGRIDLLRL